MLSKQELIVNKMLAALYNGSVPIDRMEESYEIKGELQAIVRRVLSRAPTKRQYTKCPISPESARATARIVELYAGGPRQGGKTMAEVAQIMEAEGFKGQNGPLSTDACAHRYKCWVDAQDTAPVVEKPADIFEKPPGPEVSPTVAQEEPEKPLLPPCEACGVECGQGAVARGGKFYCSKKCVNASAEKAAAAVDPDFTPEVDTKIVSMKKRGMLGIEIAQSLMRKHSGIFTGPKVDARYEELVKGGSRHDSCEM